MRLFLENALGKLLVLLFLATILAVIWQVIGRYVLETPSSATEEVARFLLIWIGMLSSAYAFARKMHVGVDLISSRLNQRGLKISATMIWAACALLSVLVLVYGGARLVMITAILGQTSPALGLPVWTIYTVVPLSGALMTYFALSFAWEGRLADHSPTAEIDHD